MLSLYLLAYAKVPCTIYPDFQFGVCPYTSPSLTRGLENLTSLHKRLFPTINLAEPRQNDGREA